MRFVRLHQVSLDIGELSYRELEANAVCRKLGLHRRMLREGHVNLDSDVQPSRKLGRPAMWALTDAESEDLLTWVKLMEDLAQPVSKADIIVTIAKAQDAEKLGTIPFWMA